MFYSHFLFLGGIFTFYEQAKKEYQRILTQIQSLQSKIKSLPEGKFICARNGGCYKWYHNTGHAKNYIPKKERAFAEKLATKKYFSLLLNHLNSEKNALEYYFKHHSEHNIEAIESLLSNPGYQNLLSTSFSSKSQELASWANTPYNSNTIHPEKLVHKTSAGIFVRSKSEAMIVLLLQTNQIPFRYECELKLGSTILFPDFTIRHPKTGEFFYWEHFGLMDDYHYAQNAFSRLQLYNSYELTPSINLITTFETKEHPLTIDVIEKIISHYFL